MDSSESQQACRAFVANAVIRHLDLTLCPNVFVNPRAYIVCRPDVPSKNCIDPSVTYQALGALNRAPIYARSVTNTENVHIIGLDSKLKTRSSIESAQPTKNSKSVSDIVVSGESCDRRFACLAAMIRSTLSCRKWQGCESKFALNHSGSISTIYRNAADETPRAS